MNTSHKQEIPVPIEDDQTGEEAFTEEVVGGLDELILGEDEEVAV